MRPLEVWGHREAGGGQCDWDEAREEGVTEDLSCCWPLVWVQSQQALDELSSGVVDPRGDVVLVALDERVGVLQALGLKRGLPHQQCVAMATTHTETTCQPVTCQPTHCPQLTGRSQGTRCPPQSCGPSCSEPREQCSWECHTGSYRRCGVSSLCHQPRPTPPTSCALRHVPPWWPAQSHQS